MTLPGFQTFAAPRPLLEPADLKRPLLTLWAVFAIFYFSELANFSLSIDEETAIYRTDAAAWVAQDRWLGYLIEGFILPPPIFPFFPLFVFGGLASLGYILVARAHRLPLADWRVALLFVLFGGFPTLFFILDFSAATVSVGVALLLSCACLALFERAMDRLDAPAGRRGGWIGLFALQVLAGAAAIGVYQSLILLVAAGCGGLFLLRYLRAPSMTLRQILAVQAYIAAGVIASIVLSLLIARGFQWLLTAHPVYLGGFVRPEQMLEEPLSVLRALAREYWAVYGGKRAVYGFRYLTFPALILLGILALAIRAPRRATAVTFVVLYGLGITLLPFAIHPLAGGALPYRTLIAVPYVFWFFAAAATLSEAPWIRRLGIALVLVAALQCLYTFSAFQAQKRLVLDHDKLLASEIYQRVVAEIPDFDRERTYPIDFYGAATYRSPFREIAGSTLSASFFEWDGGNPGRIVTFMRLLGYAGFERAPDTTRKALLPVAAAMPIWPAQGSVRVIDGTILVRLGREPGVWHRRLMPAGEQP